jgi:dihydrofolate reductase|tara:strand:+ start:2269 stop:2790 length:522 start_codon:yes stop_codon:yes gene_type:complete
MLVNVIVAYCKNGGIGINNTLPWKISSDLKKFKKITVGNKNNAIVMGKNTWTSLTKGALPMRDNLILSTSLDIDILEPSGYITKSFKNEHLLKEFIDKKNYDELWIVGGENIYDLFLKKTDIFKINKIVVTLIDESVECDKFFPKIDTDKYSFISKSIQPTDQYKVYDIMYIQ